MKKRAVNLNPYRYTLTALWCDLYNRYHDSGQYDKASTVLRFVRQIPVE